MNNFHPQYAFLYLGANSFARAIAHNALGTVTEPIIIEYLWRETYFQYLVNTYLAHNLRLFLLNIRKRRPVAVCARDNKECVLDQCFRISL